MIEEAKRGVKNTNNYRIMCAFWSNPGKWMSAADISNRVGGLNARSIGHKLMYMMEDCPHIEKMHTEGTRAYYRYVGDVPENPVIPSNRIVPRYV